MNRVVKTLLAVGIALGIGLGSLASSPIAQDTPLRLRDLVAAYKDLYASGRYRDAALTSSRAIEMGTEQFGAISLQVAMLKNDAAAISAELGQYARAEELLQSAIEIAQSTGGGSPTLLATLENNLAESLRKQGRLSDAKSHYENALKILEANGGEPRGYVLTTKNNRAILKKELGEYADAEKEFLEVLEERSSTSDQSGAPLAQTLGELGDLQKIRGQYPEAEATYRRALDTLQQRSLGSGLEAANVLSKLALLFRTEGRFSEAEHLNRRALEIVERALGQKHPSIATHLANLGVVLLAQDRFSQAAELFLGAIDIWRDTIGVAHPFVAKAQNNLALIYQATGRSDDAIKLHREALTSLEAALGQFHPDLTPVLNGLGEVYRKRGAFGDAEEMYKRAVRIVESAVGPAHPSLARALDGLATVLQDEGKIEEALIVSRRATGLLRQHLQFGYASTAFGYDTETGDVERRAWGGAFRRYTDLLVASLDASAADYVERATESFEAAQATQISSAARSIEGMVLRGAFHDARIGAAVREWQDLGARLTAMQSNALRSAANAPQPGDEESSRLLAADVQAQMKEIEQALLRDVPDFFDALGFYPVPMREVQSLLAPDEALLYYSRDFKKRVIHLWVLRSGEFAILTLPVSPAAILIAVRELRAGINLKDIKRPDDLPAFDTALAYELYMELLRPAERLLVGVSNILVVPDSVMSSLPFSMLVTEDNNAPISDLEDYRSVSWLVNKYAFTTLPAVSSLRALRAHGGGSNARKPFLGVGDPVLPAREKDIAKEETAKEAIGQDSGAFEDANRLEPLPDSATEIRAVGEALGASPESMWLRIDATEARIKRAQDLDQYRVILFATHGLLPGQFPGLTEPAIVLTPSNDAAGQEDGLLTASEISSLRLDAEWVVLSACNTALGGVAATDGLSDLARALFYAGTRAILVSHWSVETTSAVKLSTGLFKALAKDPQLGRARALQAAMKDLISDRSFPGYGHPAFWAPFVIIGEGGAYQS